MRNDGCSAIRNIYIMATHIFRLRVALLGVLLLLGASAPATAQASVTVAWDRNPELDVVGYILSWGTTPGNYPSSVNVGNVTQYTVPGLDPNQRYLFSVQAYNADSALSDRSAVVQNGAVGVQTGIPLVDLRPGIFWHNSTTGMLRTWHLSGATVLDTRKITIEGVPDTHWFVAGTGDLNGDGYPDILWRHDTEGWLAAWLLQNQQVIATQYLSIDRMLDPKWRIAALGDTDGDGRDDIIWQHDDGWLAVWEMRGTTVSRTVFLDTPRVSDTRWKIVAATDLNGDHKADLIWREQTEGWVAAWYLNGTAVTFTDYLSQRKVADLDWVLVAAGDVDGSGVPGLVWQHRVNRNICIWLMRGTSIVTTYLTNPDTVLDPAWRIVGSR
jgi:hypothetical protein